MLRILRKIRFDAFTKNKVVKYLLYASGEVLLVVIGILIALQVNNWNEERKTVILEMEYLDLFKDELQTNIHQLERSIDYYSKNAINAKILVELSPDDLNKLPADSLDILIRRAFIEGRKWFPVSNGVISEILSTGNLRIIRNPEIRKFISSWSYRVDEIKIQEGSIIDNKDNIRNIFVIYGMNKAKNSWNTFNQEQKVSLLKSMEVESRAGTFVGQASYLIKLRYNPFLEDMRTMIQIIEKNIDELKAK